MKQIEKNTEKLFCDIMKKVLKETKDGVNFRIIVEEVDNKTYLIIEKYTPKSDFNYKIEYPKIEYNCDKIDLEHLKVLFIMCDLKCDYEENTLIGWIKSSKVKKYRKINR